MFQKICCVLVALCGLLIGVQTAAAQEDTIITPESATTLTLMAELYFDPDGEGVMNDGEIVWSADGTRIAIGEGTKAAVYNLQNPSRLPFRRNTAEEEQGGCGPTLKIIRDLAFHPSQPLIALTTLEALEVWDYTTNGRVAGLSISLDDITFDSGGNLVYFDAESLSFVRWNYLANSTQSLDLSTEIYPSSFALSPDNTLLGTMNSAGLIKVQRFETGAPVQTLQPTICEGGGGGGCSAPPDFEVLSFGASNGFVTGRTSPSCDYAYDINVYDIASGKIRMALPTTFGSSSASPISDLVAVMEPDGRGIHVHSAQSGTPLKFLPHEGASAAAFSPDSTRLATVSYGVARIWSLPQNLPTREQAAAYSNVIVDADCDSETVGQQVRSGASVSVGWSWYAQTREQLQAHIDHATYEPLQRDEPTREHWIFVTQPERAAEYDDNWTVYYYMPIGTPPQGRFAVGYQLTWDETISDGYATYGPDADDIGNVTLFAGCNVDVGT